MSRDLLARLREVEGAEEREIIVLSLSLERLDPRVREAVLAVAVPHWFDQDLVSALIPVGEIDASWVISQLASLSFVEAIPARGFGVHERSRTLILADLWHTRRELFLDISRRAAACFLRRAEDGEAQWMLSEAIYHLLVADPPAGLAELQTISEMWYGEGAYNNLETMLQLAHEHVNAGRLVGQAGGWVLYWEALLDGRQSRFESAELKLRSVEESAGNDERLISEAQSARRYVEWLQRSPEQEFISHLTPIERMAKYIGRRRGLNADQIEECASYVKKSLAEDDYHLFRDFRGYSSLGTYLHVVIDRLINTYSARLVQDGRPSGEESTLVRDETVHARVALDSLPVSIDGANLDGSSVHVGRSDAALPQGFGEKAGEEELLPLVANGLRPDERLLEMEMQIQREEISRKLHIVMSRLSSADRAIISMRVLQGKSYKEIATMVGVSARRVRDRVGTLLTGIRSGLSAQGVTETAVKELF